MGSLQQKRTGKKNMYDQSKKATHFGQREGSLINRLSIQKWEVLYYENGD